MVRTGRVGSFAACPALLFRSLSPDASFCYVHQLRLVTRDMWKVSVSCRALSVSDSGLRMMEISEAVLDVMHLYGIRLART